MGNDIPLITKEIAFGSPEQKESINLRYKILREPLGLQFDENDLANEYEYYHIATYTNGELVGILLLQPQENPGVIKMRQVAVDEAWQGKGVGRAMVKFSEQFAIKKGFAKLELAARETAIPFYLSLGYVLEGDMFYEVGVSHKKMVKFLT